MDIDEAWNDASSSDGGEPKSTSDDLTSLTWLQNINILTVPGPPTPPASPKPTKKSKVNAIKEVELLEYRTTREDKPPFSYATLICMAMKANKNKMTLSSIYAWIKDNFLYYQKAEPSWQNSIRHNLSLNRCFVKIPRSKDEPGKGGFWRLDPVFSESMDNGEKLYRLRKRRSNPKTTGSGPERRGFKGLGIGKDKVPVVNQAHPTVIVDARLNNNTVSGTMEQGLDETPLNIQHSCNDLSCLENQALHAQRPEEMGQQLQIPNSGNNYLSSSPSNIIQHIQHTSSVPPTVAVLESVQMFETIEAAQLPSDFFERAEAEQIIGPNGECVYVYVTSNSNIKDFHSHNSDSLHTTNNNAGEAQPVTNNAICVPTTIDHTVEIPLEGGTAVVESQNSFVDMQSHLQNTLESSSTIPDTTHELEQHLLQHLHPQHSEQIPHHLHHHQPSSSQHEFPHDVSEVIELSSMNGHHHSSAEHQFQIQLNGQGMSNEFSSGVVWDDRCAPGGLNFFESVLDLDELISIGEL